VQYNSFPPELWSGQFAWHLTVVSSIRFPAWHGEWWHARSRIWMHTSVIIMALVATALLVVGAIPAGRANSVLPQVLLPIIINY